MCFMCTCEIRNINIKYNFFFCKFYILKFKINVSSDQLYFFQVAGYQANMSTSNTPQLLPRSLVNSWELEESQGVQGGFAAHLLSSLPAESSDTHPLLSDILLGRECPSHPLLLFLSHRHLWVLRIDFGELTDRVRKSPNVNPSSWSRLVRVPLGSVVIHPGQSGSHIGDGDSSRCSDPRHHRRYLPFNKTGCFGRSSSVSYQEKRVL